MGERLNIEIEANGETVANAYYHWGAQTSTALELVNRMIEYFKSVNDTYQNEQELALRLLEASGATLTEKEYEYVNKLRLKTQPFDKHTVDRNNGLISLSENGMNETRKWQEISLRVSIDLNHHSVAVAFDDVFDVVTLDDYKMALNDEGYEYDEDAITYDDAMVDAFTHDGYLDATSFQTAFQAYESLEGEYDVFYANQDKTMVAVILQ